MALLFYIGLTSPIVLSIITFLKTDKRWERTTNWIFLISSIITVLGIALGFYGTMTTLLVLPVFIGYHGSIPNDQEILGVGIFATWCAIYPLAKILSSKITEMRIQSPIKNFRDTMIYFYGLHIIISAIGLLVFVR